MRLIGLVVVLIVSLVLEPLTADAQQETKAKVVGVLSLSSPETSAHLSKAGSDALRELGWVRSQNFNSACSTNAAKSSVQQ
jgi:hypothetical protein